jgi:alpha-amylase/alpha-mannosidase (GH57 family)
MTQVAILWHMHQPYYEDLLTHEHVLPWVRLHALKDYFGMAALMREFPDVRLTFNLVPSLLVQLEAFAEDRARDRFLELSLKPATELAEADAAFMVGNFFHAQRSRMIDAYPRYAELLQRRGPAAPTGTEARALARRFGPDELRDLQVWHKLAWIDPEYQARDERVRRLIEKGRDFTEDDKMALRTVELELLNKVIPAYRGLAASGQIELSTSPFYHPILPLLCDTNVYLRTHPESRMPRQRFVHPEDAAEQIAKAVACHERLFGHRPAGLWPSEGSVSDAMVPIVARAGFKWMATDELILARTLGASFGRDGNAHLEQPERLYVPYSVNIGDARVACAFRDHVLSDRIGFVYADWPAEAAADDLVGRLVEAGRRYANRTQGKEAFIPVILDGENAWEYFEGGGRPFLRALYRRLSGHPELRTVTMSEGCATPRADLGSIFPGSWIDANFSIWIGHPDDQRAWSQLADARAALDAATGVDESAARQAREEILIAEGSDWFWWYGDDHSSPLDFEFDALFRRHLRNAYKLLRTQIPDELFLSNISTSPPPPAQTDPAGMVTPKLDGEETSYFEWMGAGALEVRETAGAMRRADRQASMLTLVMFGFERDRFYVRVDGRRPMAELLADGYEVSLKFLRPPAMRFSIRVRLGHLSGVFWEWGAEGPRWVERGPRGSTVAAGTILEVALPFADLKVGAGDSVAFFVAVYDSADVEVERHPGNLPIEVELPDGRFEARNWAV